MTPGDDVIVTGFTLPEPPLELLLLPEDEWSLPRKFQQFRVHKLYIIYWSRFLANLYSTRSLVRSGGHRWSILITSPHSNYKTFGRKLVFLLDFRVFLLKIGSKMSIFDAYWLKSNLISLEIQLYFMTRNRFCSLFVSTSKELSISFYWTVHNFRTTSYQQQLYETTQKSDLF